MWPNFRLFRNPTGPSARSQIAFHPVISSRVPGTAFCSHLSTLVVFRGKCVPMSPRPRRPQQKRHRKKKNKAHAQALPRPNATGPFNRTASASRQHHGRPLFQPVQNRTQFHFAANRVSQLPFGAISPASAASGRTNPTPRINGAELEWRYSVAANW